MAAGMSAGPRPRSQPALRRHAMLLADYDYDLPDERVAQEPVTPRDSARLLVVPRDRGEAISHRVFRDLPDLLAPGDLLVVNETRVSAARLLGHRAGFAGAVEALVLRPAIEHGPDHYEALVRPGRKVREGERLVFEAACLGAEVAARAPESGGRILRLYPLSESGGGDVAELLEARGRVPLPPYITRPLADRSRYQTVYARTPGSAAAPTAGLHFTPGLLDRLREKGVGLATVRLDVGLGTFRPIRDGDVTRHEMHAETFEVPAETADAVNACRGSVIAVGTTSLRALESAAQGVPDDGSRVRAASGETRLYVLPGYEFRAVDGLVTNFHQPHSTLLLLVAALLGRERMREAYATALAEGYRFLSFGDAMFCCPRRRAVVGG